MSTKYKAKKQLGGQKVFRKWGEYSVGDVVVGSYQGIHLDKTYNKENLLMKVEEAFCADTTFSKQVVGKVLCLNAAGFLNQAAETLQEGDIFQVEYSGKSEIQKGAYAGKEAHTGIVTLLEVDEGESYVESDEELGL